MARAAKSSDIDILKAVERLKTEGKVVTPYALQRLLGGGSQDYYRKALERLRMDPENQVDDVDPVQKQLQEKVDELASALREFANRDAEARIAKIESGSKAALAKTEVQLEQTAHLLKDAQRELEAERLARAKSERDCEQLTSELKLVREELQRSRGALAEAAQESAVLAKAYEGLEVQTAHLKENLTRTQDMARAQIETVSRDATIKVNHAQGEASDYKQERNEAREARDEALRRQADAYKDNVRQSESLKQLNGELVSLKAQQTADQHRADQLQASNQTLTASLAVAEAKLEALAMDQVGLYCTKTLSVLQDMAVLEPMPAATLKSCVETIYRHTPFDEPKLRSATLDRLKPLVLVEQSEDS